MSIILSHSTARLYHRAPLRPDAPKRLPLHDRPVPSSALDQVAVQDARRKLARYGVPGIMLEMLDVLVGRPQERNQALGARFHVYEGSLPARSMMDLGEGVLVTDIRLTALHAARDMEFRELVEYFYEICGGYSLPLDEDGDYEERAPLTTVAELGKFFDSIDKRHGLVLARRALRYVRDGARSPMETAMAMMLVMPKREGGLGIRRLEMDYRVEVSQRAEHLTACRCFYCDAYIPRWRLDIEYHGFFHDEERRSVSDDERVNALRAMGIDVIVIRRWAFFDARAFRRFLNGVCRAIRLAPSKFPHSFANVQEDLRRFVLRRYL